LNFLIFCIFFVFFRIVFELIHVLTKKQITNAIQIKSNPNDITNLIQMKSRMPNSISKFDFQLRFPNSISKFDFQLRFPNSISMRHLSNAYDIYGRIPNTNFDASNPTAFDTCRELQGQQNTREILSGFWGFCFRILGILMILFYVRIYSRYHLWFVYNKVTSADRY
jgi:hypothetical protein